MILINRIELKNRLDGLNISEDVLEKILNIIEDMPYLDCVNMILINRIELENRLYGLNISEDVLEKILDTIEDMPHLDCVKLTNGDIKGNWRE